MTVKLEILGTELFRRRREPALRIHIARERKVLAQIVTGVPLAQVLRELLRDVEASTGYNMRTSILELSEDGERLYHLAAPSLPASFLEAINGAPVGAAAGSCGTAIFRDTPVYVVDIASDPLWKDYRDVALGHGLRACWSTPIRGMDGAPLGTFALYYDEPLSPRPRDIEAIAAVTLTVALAIERHRGELALRRARDELSALSSRGAC